MCEFVCECVSVCMSEFVCERLFVCWCVCECLSFSCAKNRERVSE